VVEKLVAYVPPAPKLTRENEVVAGNAIPAAEPSSATRNIAPAAEAVVEPLAAAAAPAAVVEEVMSVVAAADPAT
jgi:hypothetical protein